MMRLSISSSSTRPINILMNNGVQVTCVRNANDCISCNIAHHDVTRARELLGDYSISIEDHSPLKFLSDLIHARSGIILGLVVSTLIIALMSNMTLKITVLGVDDTMRESIEETLLSQGIVSKRLGKYNTQEVIRLVEDTSKTSSYVSAYYRGSELVVSILGELNTPELESTASHSIIANYDGIITRIIAIEGTPLVKVGESVRRGDRLIAPYVVYGEGEEERHREVVPRGKVYAKTYLEETIYLTDGAYYLVESGRCTTLHRLGNATPKSPYEHYTVTTEKHRLFGILPLPYTSYCYRELRMEKLDFSDKELLNNVVNYAYSKLDEEIFEGEKLLNKWFFEKRLDNTRIISVYYEVEKLISGG